MLHRTLAGLLLTSLVAGCMPTPVASTGPQHVQHTDPTRIQGRFVPAGARFTVRLDQTIDTLASDRGQRFSATVSTPVRGADGQVIVASGAKVFGHVQSVNGASGPRLRLHFETVETTDGPVALQVRIASSDLLTYAGPPQLVGAPLGYDTWYGPYYGSYPVPVGGGPIPTPMYGYNYSGWYGYDMYTPREVRLPAGAAMDLLLTRPLLAPGARELPHR